MRTQYDQADVGRVIERLCAAIAEAFKPGEALSIIGIRTRGEVLAQRLTERLRGLGFGKIGRGVLDITLYRDDLADAGAKAVVQPTEVDFDINAKPMVLVDDVLFTGRSIRSALDAIIDLGRPSVIRLAVLVDRGGRELPIQADFVGLKLTDVSGEHRVNVLLVESDGRDEIVVKPKPGRRP